MPETLTGLIERVTFFNEENGFAVLKVKVKGKRDEVAVVGSLPSANPGEWLTAQGRWVQDKQFGLQFRAELLTSTAPTTGEGIEKYLGSGLIKGIGPVYAKKLVAQFGERIFDIIESESGRLEDLEGIGPKRRRQIKEAWAEQKVIRDIMVFLHSNGVSTSRAVRIYKTYGQKAVEIVRANPYTLAQDIHGIGFKTADQIAQKMGVPHDSLLRARAALRHVLLEATGEGHCALPANMLKEKSGALLQVDPKIVHEALDDALKEKEVVLEVQSPRSKVQSPEPTDQGADSRGHPTLDTRHSEHRGQRTEDRGQRSEPGHSTLDIRHSDGLVFLPALKRAEEGIAGRIRQLCSAPASYPPIDFAKALEWCERKTAKALAPSQRAALEQALTRRVLIITGGPGVGKTTLLNALLLILTAKKVRCQLCAPTGRAARRLSEATGHQARTIHRLLEVDPTRGGFLRKEDRPLECDFLVIDEVSMVDVPLMNSVLRALPSDAHLVLVGDDDQLPSVGPGMVLRNLIESGLVAVARLTEVFRQAANSRIITNAHRINEGLMPDTERGPSRPAALPEAPRAPSITTATAPEPEPTDEASDFHFIERDSPETISDTLLEIVQRRIPARFGLDPIRDVQVLCPMNRGALGVRELNLRLQAALNPARANEPLVEKFGSQFRPRDKVIQTENDYDKDVFNGDIGQVLTVDSQERQVLVRFDQRDVTYDFGELDELSLAYAITIHKSQGSEFPAVVIPLATQHYLLLQRNLVYTGVTRGKKLVVLIGQRKALAMAIQNNRTRQRFSGLLGRLTQTPDPLRATNEHN